MLRHQGVQQLGPVRGEFALFLQDVRKWPVFFEHPRIHRGDQGIARNEVHLNREDAEQQIAIGRHGELPGKRMGEMLPEDVSPGNRSARRVRYAGA